MILRHCGKFITISAAICLLIAGPQAFQPVSSEQSVKATDKVAEGLRTATFETPSGKININFPEDMAAGDTLSGTVIAEPVGNTPEEIAKATDELNGYVVEVKKAEEAPPRVAEQPVPPKPHEHKEPKHASAPQKYPRVCPGHPFTCMLPAMPLPLDVILTRNDKPVCKCPVEYPHSPPEGHVCSDGDCMIPSAGQAGHPVTINTACDGRSDNSSVCVGGKPCQILAESPRSMVAKTPKNIVGSSELKVQEGDKVATAPFCCLAVKLRACKSVLKKGETTTVTVMVSGLADVKGPVRLRILNKTPQTIQMEGGNDKTITIGG